MAYSFLQWYELLVWARLAHSNHWFGSFSLAEDAIDCCVDFGSSSVKYVLSVGNSSTGNCPNWDVHRIGGIILFAL